jgi:hypothetical protein
MAKQQQVTTTTENLPPADLLEDMQKHAGEGVSKAQDDNLVPLVYILQKQSPQVEKRDSKYVEGAEAADIWLRNAPSPIVKGEEGILFQPCYFSIDWVEWVPRDKGGGFVARHKELPKDAAKHVDPQNPNKVKYLRPNGNEVIQTRNHIGYVLNGKQPLPYVIPMYSSGHTTSREWMFRINSQQLPNGQTAASYARLYRLRTRARSNQLGTWYSWDIADEGWVSKDQWERGKQLYKAFAGGEKEAEAPIAPDETVTDDNAPM